MTFITLSQDIFSVFLETNWTNLHDIQEALINIDVNFCQVTD